MTTNSILPPVFITGGTGYLGSRLVAALLQQGYPVTAMVREQSVGKLPKGCGVVFADAFDAASFAQKIPSGSIFIQLLGVQHPGPRKQALFHTVDLASVKASVIAAKQAGVMHFIYVSVAQYPTKLMEAYQQVRATAEQLILSAGLKATFIRPWYIVGPGHYWPLLFQPLFWLMAHIPATSTKAKALALIPLRKMLLALQSAVETVPTNECRIIEIEEILKM